jgi:hypothetical protein
VARLRQVPPFIAGWLRAASHRPGPARFTFDGRELPYFYDRYNNTWLNERAVEVPLARAALAHGGDMLEVGNVLGHYGHLGHEVVDKYERAPGVQNIDVLDLDRARRWDVVISISTIEHVGVDDTPKDPTRGVAAMQLLADAVRPGGTLLVTIPVGYNPVLDAALVGGEIPGVRTRGLLHVNSGARWREVPAAEAAQCPYDYGARSACGLLVEQLA